MKYHYSLKIETKSPEISQKLNSIFQVEGSPIKTEWEYATIENEDDPYHDFIALFSNMIIENRDDLLRLGIKEDDISVWMLYEYENQCNMEFHPEQLGKLAKAGVTFCISCWENDESKIKKN